MIIFFVPRGSHLITVLKTKNMMSQESSLAHCCTLAPPAAQLQTILQSPTVGTDSASRTLSNAARVLPVQLPRDFVMVGVCRTTNHGQPVSLVSVHVLHIRRLLAPHVPSLLSRHWRRNAVDNVRTFLLPHPHASIVLLLRLMNLANSSVEHLVGIVEDPYWRSGGSVPHLTSAQLP